MSPYRSSGGLTQQQGWVILGLLLFIIVLGLNGWSLESLEERWDTMQEEREPRVISKEEGAAWTTALLIALFWLGVSGVALARYRKVTQLLDKVEAAWRDPRILGFVVFSFYGVLWLTLLFLQPGELVQAVLNVLSFCVLAAVVDDLIWSRKESRRKELQRYPVAAWFNRMDGPARRRAFHG